MDLEGGTGLHTDESAGVSFYAQPSQSSQHWVEAIKLFCCCGLNLLRLPVCLFVSDRIRILALPRQRPALFHPDDQRWSGMSAEWAAPSSAGSKPSDSPEPNALAEPLPSCLMLSKRISEWSQVHCRVNEAERLLASPWLTRPTRTHTHRNVTYLDTENVSLSLDMLTVNSIIMPIDFDMTKTSKTETLRQVNTSNQGRNNTTLPKCYAVKWPEESICFVPGHKTTSLLCFIRAKSQDPSHSRRGMYVFLLQ